MLLTHPEIVFATRPSILGSGAWWDKRNAKNMADFTDEFADSAAGADDDFGTSPADLAAQLDAEEAALDDSDGNGVGVVLFFSRVG